MSESVSSKIGFIIIILIHFLAIIGSILLARHNLKVGRGDLRGALKLSIFLFSILFTGRMFYSDHVPIVWGELAIIYQAFAFSLASALFSGLMYVALEPFVRRYWSELLISWNRLLAGDFRDPLVGRDILFGLLLGLGHTVCIFLGDVLFALITNNNGVFSTDYRSQPVNGLPGIIFRMTDSVADAVSFSFLLLFILLGFFILTKNKKLSVFLLFILFSILLGLFFVLTQHWVYIFAVIIISVCFVVALAKFGLIGQISFYIGFFLSYLNPLTLDSSSLYFPNTIFTLILIFALAAYAFYISTAGQPIFKKRLISEDE